MSKSALSLEPVLYWELVRLVLGCLNEENGWPSLGTKII